MPMLKYKNPDLPVEERVSDLLSRMTLREKIAQLDMKFGNDYSLSREPAHRCSIPEDSDYHYDKLKEDFPDGIGFIHDNYSVPKIMNRLQRFMMEQSRLGIPVIFTGEALHGICGLRSTILPIPTAWAAAFDRDLAFEAGRVIATEARSLGIYEVLCPNLDVARDPRWGRTEETFGEDTYLAAQTGVAFVKGLQNGDISAPDSVIAEPKHFCVHGIAEGGLNCAPARAGRREIESSYLPVFEAAFKEGGAYDTMICYNSIDGEAVIGSEYYMTEVLKKRMGLKGICRSDWSAMERLKNDHFVAETDEDVIRITKNAGLDCQGGFEYPNRFWVDTLEKLVNEGKVSEENINDSCSRVLRLKFLLGLFEHPFTDEDAYKSVINRPEHLETALRIARKSAILLKNNGILPLDLKAYKKIALVGPSSDKLRLGGYCQQPDHRETETLFDVFRRELPGCDIRQSNGCGIGSDGLDFALSDQQHLADIDLKAIDGDMDEAVALAADSDLIIFCGGDDDITGGEGRDRADVTLCGRQKELIGRLSATGRPLITVIIHGKPLSITHEVERSDAALSIWYGGEKGPQAIFDVLSGKVNPAGRLPFSLPREPMMIPCYYSRLPGGSNSYYEGEPDPPFPFGFGLSYTKFEYSDMTIKKLGPAKAEVGLTVKNIGKAAGDEVVQIYVEDCVSSVVTPRLLLRDYLRISLEPGEEKRVSFTLGEKAFGLVNRDHKWAVEKGRFIIYAGAASNDLRLQADFYADDVLPEEYDK